MGEGVFGFVAQSPPADAARRAGDVVRGRTCMRHARGRQAGPRSVQTAYVAALGDQPAWVSIKLRQAGALD